MPPGLLLIAMVCGAAWAGPDDRHEAPRTPVVGPATAAAPPAPAPTAARNALDEAVRLYREGDTDGARQLIQRLLALGPALPVDVRRDAYAWLGEIQLSEHGEAAANNSFETLLAEAPDYVMDPYQHPPEVCEAFERARQRLATTVLTPPPPVVDEREPWPALTLAPFGAFYFKEGRVGAGLAVGAVQVAGLTGSVVTGVRMAQLNRDGADTSDEQRFRRLRPLNLGAGAVAWVAWGTPVLVETVRWSAAQPVNLQVGPGYVGVGGRF